MVGTLQSAQGLAAMGGKHTGTQPEAVAAALETMAHIASAAEGGKAQFTSTHAQRTVARKASFGTFRV